MKVPKGDDTYEEKCIITATFGGDQKFLPGGPTGDFRQTLSSQDKNFAVCDELEGENFNSRD